MLRLLFIIPGTRTGLPAKRYPVTSPMITDVRTLPDGTAIEADICIVGAGAAGITLAMELLGHGFRIALLESGGLDFEDDIQSLNDGDCVSEQKVDLTWSRLRYFGGTTGHWGGNCAPLDALISRTVLGAGQRLAVSTRRNWRSSTPARTSTANCRRIIYRARSLGGSVRQVPDQPHPGQRRSDRREDLPEEPADPVRRSLPRRPGQAGQPVHGLSPCQCGGDRDRSGRGAGRGAADPRPGWQEPPVHGEDIHPGQRHRERAAAAAVQPVRPNGLGNDHDMVGRYFMAHTTLRTGTGASVGAEGNDAALRTGGWASAFRDRRRSLRQRAPADQRRRRSGMGC